ncbi:hypothetical protein BXZ70DRAFT_1012320 [Cristinia sonorae]|uniref:Uncharacterized protein n=1 Tax=Cristinia sonorae TaxID=1940300 RepID=A0A8K0UFW8_9AGAR|nr:hypothetical protein BXZ70DRAFT_1012320 [Cristinia sonorae]
MSQQTSEDPVLPSASTLSLASTATASSTSSTSTLIPKRPARKAATSSSTLVNSPAQTKDWEAAFGALSSSYGFGGGAPITVKKVNKGEKKSGGSGDASASKGDSGSTAAKK